MLYYVYVISDPRDGQPFYVGMGKNNRAESHLLTSPSKQKSNPHRFRKIKQIQEAGLQPVVTIIADGFTQKADAGTYERELIAKYGRRCNGTGILTNIKPGGLGGKHVDNEDYTSNKPVDQYNRLGNFIQTFPSAAEAARSVNSKNSQAISMCCHKSGNAKTHKGYFWSFTGVPLDTVWCWVKTKPVYQWTLSGQFVSKYASSSDAARALGITRASIGECLNSNVPMAGNFMWTYDNTAPVYKGKRKQILCVNTNQIYLTIGEAAKHLELDHSGLAAAIRNNKKCKGYSFVVVA